MYFNWVIPSLIRTWKHTKTLRHNIATVRLPAGSQLAAVPTSPGTCWVYHQQMHYTSLGHAGKENTLQSAPFPVKSARLCTASPLKRGFQLQNKPPSTPEQSGL